MLMNTDIHKEGKGVIPRILPLVSKNRCSYQSTRCPKGHQSVFSQTTTSWGVCIYLEPRGGKTAVSTHTLSHRQRLPGWLYAVYVGDRGDAGCETAWTCFFSTKHPSWLSSLFQLRGPEKDGIVVAINKEHIPKLRSKIKWCLGQLINIKILDKISQQWSKCSYGNDHIKQTIPHFTPKSSNIKI